jgi:hypothetical protein
MAAASVQSRKTYFTGRTGSLAFSSNVAAGSLLVCSYHMYAGNLAASACSDNINGAWTKEETGNGGDGSLQLIVFYKVNSGAGACTVSFDAGATGAVTSVTINEVSGVATSTPVDVSPAMATGTGTAVAINYDPAQSGDYVYAAMTSMAGDAQTIAPDADFTQLEEYEDGATYMHMNTQYRVYGSDAADTANWTIGSSLGWIASVVAFKAAAGGPVGTESNQAQVSDVSGITSQGPTYNITPAQANQAQVSEAAPPDYHQPEPIQITAAQNFQAQGSDPAVITLTGATNITVAEGKQAQVSDAAIMGVIHTIAPAQNNQAQASDAASLSTDALIITPVGGNQAQVSDAATIGVITPIAPAQNNQAQVSDAAILSGAINITPAQANQAQVSDPSIFGAITPIAAAQDFQAQVSDPSIFGVISPITPAQGNQAQVSDAVSLTSYAPTFIITVADGTQAQVSDAAGITFTAAGATFSITPAEAHQVQVSDAVILSLLGGLVLHGNRRLYPVSSRTTGATGARSTYSVNRRDTGEVDDDN